ncbi:MAG: efflux RND transporter periplasmic adaptor subunit [Bacteroidales bacterium]
MTEFKLKRSVFFLFVIIASSLIFNACKSGSSNNKTVNRQAAILRVEGVIVTPSVLDQTISISGTLKPFEETVLMPEVAGRVVDLNLSEGGFAKKGTLLVKLFDGDLQAQLKKSKAQLELEEQIEKRQSELMKVSGISQLDLDQTILQINSIKADIEVLVVQINKTEVRAPFDGTIGLRNVSIGAQVTSSTALATIRDVKHLKLDFSVAEKYGSTIKPGFKVKFTVQGSDIKYDATVMATEQGIEAETRNLNVRAVVANNNTSLIPGASAHVDLRLNENNNALMVPTEAVIPQARTKQVIVAKNGKASFVTITTGIRTSSSVQVLSGINSGDTVVTTGILFLKPGAALKFSKVKSNPL